MIGKLKGLVDGFGDDFVHVDVNGVVYEVFCSAKTMASMPQVGHASVVHIETIVREDMIRLYGFFTEAEKAWFTTLMTVQGVGSRVALAILSVLTPSELASAIALQDKAMVGRANGVGPKLAVRIITELKGKAPAGAIDAGVLGLQAALGEGVAAEVGSLHFLLEGFYRDRDRTVHELGFYYEVALPDAFPFRVGEVCHRVEDGGVMLEFLWVPWDEAGLNEASLYPVILRDRLAELPATTTHLIVSEL